MERINMAGQGDSYTVYLYSNLGQEEGGCVVR